jgi:amidase
MNDLNTLGAVEAAALIAAGTISSEQLTLACLERIHARDPNVLAWAHLEPALALAEARERDLERNHGHIRGPLHGLPIGVKDIIDTVGLPTEYGTPIYQGHRPVADAACVVAAREQGAIVLGKTVSTELANRHPAITRNPHNLEHTPGGSSSGSAAAVADRMVPLAFGTQTGGSLIRPAAYCGVVGYKPTFNSINGAGIKLLSPSLDTVGVYGRDVPDAALFGGALIGLDPIAFERALPAPPRIALYRTPQWAVADRALVDAFEAGHERLARAGAHVSELVLPPAMDAIIDASNIVNDYETRRSLAYERVYHLAQLSPTLGGKLVQAGRWTRNEYLAALQTVHDCRLMLEDGLRDVDVLITPAAEGEAPRGLENVGKTAFHQMWTMLHVPSVAIPVFTGPTGLPMGVQVISTRGQDVRALQAAHWIQQVLRS